jgi:two-component system, NarL family, sensor kinase
MRVFKIILLEDFIKRYFFVILQFNSLSSVCMRTSFFIFITLFSTFVCLAHTWQDNLEKIEKKRIAWQQKPKSWQRDTNIVNLLLDRSSLEAQNVNTEKAINTAQEALQMSQQLAWKKGIVRSLYMMAETEQVKSQYFTSIKHCLKALQLINKQEMPDLYLNCTRLVAACYLWMEKPKEALLYYQLFFKDNPIKHSKPGTLNDVYTEIGILHTKLIPNPTKAMQYYEQARKGYEAQKDTFGMAYMNSYLGLTYEQLKQPQLAENAFIFAIFYYRKLQAGYLLPDALNNAASYYQRKGNFKKADTLAKEALYLAKKLSVLYSIRDANRILYHNNKANGNAEKALLHFEAFANARDSMSQANIDDRLKVVRYEYDTQIQKVEIEKKNKENQQKNMLIISLLVCFIALSVISILSYRNIRIRKEIAEKEIIQLQQEKQLTATESIIKGQEEERSRLAKDLHDGLGGLLSGIKYSLNTMTGNVILSEQNANIFTRALGQLDNAIVEMRRVAHSMMPEALLKFGLIDAVRDFCEGINQSGKLKVHFQAYGIEERLNQSTEITLYRIVQELLNNIMKHAEAMDAYVQLSEADGLLTLSVEDNGKGFNVNDLIANKGAGMSNIESRVAYLNGKMDIQSKPDEGTSVNIEIAL